MADWTNVEIVGDDAVVINKMVRAAYLATFKAPMPEDCKWTLAKNSGRTQGKIQIGFPPDAAPPKGGKVSGGPAGPMRGLSEAAKLILVEAQKRSGQDRAGYLKRAADAGVLTADESQLIAAACFQLAEAEDKAAKAAAFLKAEAARPAVQAGKAKASKVPAKV